jgi:hypothetical protein
MTSDEDKPYWKGHDRQKDVALVMHLFVGETVRAKSGPKAGRARQRYYEHDSIQEREGFKALQRLLWHAPPEIMAFLSCAIDPDNETTDRRLVFQLRKKGKPADAVADLQVATAIAGRLRQGWEKLRGLGYDVVPTGSTMRICPHARVEQITVPSSAGPRIIERRYEGIIKTDIFELTPSKKEIAK